MADLADAYGDAIAWLEAVAGVQEIADHADSFFVNEIVLRLAGSFREVHEALRSSASEGVVLQPRLFLRLYRRLAWTFSARVTAGPTAGC